MISFTFAQDNPQTEGAQTQQPQIQQTRPEMPPPDAPYAPGNGPTPNDAPADSFDNYQPPQGPGGGRGGRGPGAFEAGQGGPGMPGGMQPPLDMPGMQPWGDASQTQTQQSANTNGFINFVNEYSSVLIAFILLALAFVFVIFYKKNTF